MATVAMMAMGGRERDGLGACPNSANSNLGNSAENGTSKLKMFPYKFLRDDRRRLQVRRLALQCGRGRGQ